MITLLKKLPKKFNLFANKGIWEWYGFCVLARFTYNGKEKVPKVAISATNDFKAVKKRLLSIKENNRVCVNRAFNKSQYGDFSQKAVWCKFVEIHFRNLRKTDFDAVFGKYCKSPGSDPWPPTYTQHQATLKGGTESGLKKMRKFRGGRSSRRGGRSSRRSSGRSSRSSRRGGRSKS